MNSIKNNYYLSTLRTNLGVYFPGLGSYDAVIQEGLVVRVGLNQGWLQV